MICRGAAINNKCALGRDDVSPRIAQTVNQLVLCSWLAYISRRLGDKARIPAEGDAISLINLGQLLSPSWGVCHQIRRKSRRLPCVYLVYFLWSLLHRLNPACLSVWRLISFSGIHECGVYCVLWCSYVIYICPLW